MDRLQEAKRKCLMEDLQKLVESFDCDDGLPESVYQATDGLIQSLLGVKSANAFCNGVDATDGRFYISQGCESVWSEVLARADLPTKSTGDNKDMEMNTKTHTPELELPWRVAYDTRIEYGPIVAGFGFCIAEVKTDCYDWQAKRDHLVKSANSHDALVSALLPPNGIDWADLVNEANAICRRAGSSFALFNAIQVMADHNRDLLSQVERK